MSVIRDCLVLPAPNKVLAAIGLLFALSAATARSQTDPKTEKQGETAGAGAKDRFLFGGTVEVLALGTHDEDPGRWWDKDGKPLASLPPPLVGCFVRQSDEDGNPLPSLPISWKKAGQVASPDPVWRRIVLRIRDLPDDAEVTWHMNGARASASGEVTVDGDRAPKGWFTGYFGVAADKKTADLNVRLATGEWKTEAKTNGFGSKAHADLSRTAL